MIDWKIMEKTFKVEITWEDKNYCCGYADSELGVIGCTDKTLDGLKHRFEESMRLHIKGMVEDGDNVPTWLANGEYKIEYSLAVSALLKQAERFTTMAVVSRITGINQKQLSHYINSVKKPREAQRERIVAGLHEIGEYFLAVH